MKQLFIDFVVNNFTREQRQRIKAKVFNFLAHFNRSNLTKLAKLYETDKWGDHYYTDIYDQHLRKFRKKKGVFLEIGIGGYDDPKAGGKSLKMWEKYFTKAKIYGFDLYDKSYHDTRRIKTFQGSQIDERFLKNTIKKIGRPDIILDDGSHINSHVIKTFHILFPLLKDGGIYIVEDTQTAYWEDFGGDSIDLNKPDTHLNLFKSLTDGLNYQEFILPNGYEPSYYDKNITSIHFYHNLVIIYKGDNTEPSNAVVNNKRLVYGEERVKTLVKEWDR